MTEPAETEGDLRFRTATDDDWPAIWAIVASVVAKGDTYAIAPDIGEAEAHDLWMGDGPGRRVTYAAIEDGVVVGTAYLRPNQAGPGDHVANAGWMMAPEAAGRGVGRKFAEYVIEDARNLGFTGMQFNAVVSTNARAIGLWESMGFEIVGTVPRAFRHPEDGLVSVHIMHRRL